MNQPKATGKETIYREESLLDQLLAQETPIVKSKPITEIQNFSLLDSLLEAPIVKAKRTRKIKEVKELESEWIEERYEETFTPNRPIYESFVLPHPTEEFGNVNDVILDAPELRAPCKYCGNYH